LVEGESPGRDHQDRVRPPGRRGNPQDAGLCPLPGAVLRDLRPRGPPGTWGVASVPIAGWDLPANVPRLVSGGRLGVEALGRRVRGGKGALVALVRSAGPGHTYGKGTRRPRAPAGRGGAPAGRAPGSSVARFGS